MSRETDVKNAFSRLNECVRNSDDEYALVILEQSIDFQNNRIKELEEDVKSERYTAKMMLRERNILQSKLNNIQELLDLTPKDIRDVAVYTYQELNEILKESE